jgi:CBS domain-containing protein
MGLHSEIKEAIEREMPSVSADDFIRVGVQKMVDAHSSGIIVKSAGKVVGVVTDMDLLLSFYRKDNLDETPISSVMTPCELITGQGAKNPCVQLDAAQSVENALGVMQLAGIHHLVITEGDNEILGAVSILDVLKLALA